MKTIKELRSGFNLYPQENASTIRFFKTQNIDWNVYLPTKGKNLQRDFVWSLKQKRELIWSVLIGRHIPHCAMINILDKNDNYKDIYLIIDGKQRLSTIFDFVDNKFTIEIDNLEYLFSELPDDYQTIINNFYFKYYLINEEFDNPITDDQKIAWFKFINFAGTPQDTIHLKTLE
jgi:uncharacterized protein with ParB-like and HNH nuclease domain